MDENNFIIFPNANLLSLKSNYLDEYLYVILGIINSKLINYFYNIYYGESNTNITKTAFESIPVFDIEKLDNFEKFQSNIKSMLNLNKEFYAIKNKFLRRAKDNLKLEKMTKKLDNFENLDFHEFVKELSKQKIKLNLKEQDEWEDSDYDGVGDNSDVFPNNYLIWKDTDGDLLPDNYDPYPYDSSKRKDYTLPPELTDLKYDNSKYDIYNLKVETFGYPTIDIEYQRGDKIGDGFLQVPDTYVRTIFFISGVIENIGNGDIEGVTLHIVYYDSNDKYVRGEFEKFGNLEKNEYSQFFHAGGAMILTEGVVERFHHFTLEINETFP